MKYTIAIIPNEDGFGTSAWAVRIAKEITMQDKNRIYNIKILVASKKLENFHKDKYSKNSLIEVVLLKNIIHKIELVKKNGSVDIANSIKQALLPYVQSVKEYKEALDKVKDMNLIIDLGVPQAANFAYNKKIKSVTVFDHAWSLTLQKIFSCNLKKHIKITNKIAIDESKTNDIYLFTTPITSNEYVTYWKEMLGKTPGKVAGSIGGPIITLEYVKSPDFLKYRSCIENKKKFPKQVHVKAKKYAKEILGIVNDDPVLFISGAGTSVWDDVLADLINDYEKNVPKYNVVIYNLKEAEKRNIKIMQFKNIKRSKVIKDRLIYIDNLLNETHVALFPAFDLVLTRAGGGTVNDAISCAVPLILVEEPNMWQVEQIRQACIDMKIAEGVTLNYFVKNKRACVENKFGDLKKLNKCRNKMLKIPNHREVDLVENFLKMVNYNASS